MLPTFYLPHGAPTFALRPGAAGTAIGNAAASLKPRAIIVASAHWHTEAPAAGGATRPETIHDFWGFPEPLYDIAYGAQGAPDVAGTVVTLLRNAGFGAALEENRGLDHAVWIPLRMMFPRADVPVVPLSIQGHLGPEHHYRLGLALAPLARDNVLVIGSGNLTHNLRDWQAAASSSMSYVREFADWVWRHIDTGDLRALLDYRRQAPEAQRAHPTEDHLLPLFVALGAAGPGFSARRIHTGIDERVLAMDAFAFQPATGALQ